MKELINHLLFVGCWLLLMIVALQLIHFVKYPTLDNFLLLLIMIMVESLTIKSIFYPCDKT